MRFRKHDPHALGAFEELDDERWAADHLDQILDIVGFMRESRDRQADTLAREQLQSSQFIPGAADGDRFVERVNTHHFKLPQHRRAVGGHRRADAGDHGIELFMAPSLVVDARAMGGDIHVAAQYIEGPHFMVA